MVKEYSLKKDGKLHVSPHFKVEELACHDGEDKVLVSTETLSMVENIRHHFGDAEVECLSGYRSPSYNASKKGAPKSQHMLGKAMDIRIKGIKPRVIAIYAESLKPGGLGLYEYKGEFDGFVHIDSRDNRSRWYQDNPDGPAQPSNGFYKEEPKAKSTLKRGAFGHSVIELQKLLRNKYKYSYVKVDGDFGIATYRAVVDFQRKHKLTADGIVGNKTWNTLL